VLHFNLESASSCGIFSNDESKLKAEALRELYESKYSLAGPGGLCDKVEDAKLADITFGTMSDAYTVGKHANPLPAIVARHDYICVINHFGTKERQLNQWFILAIDKDFNQLRCLRTGRKEHIDVLIKECKFSSETQAIAAKTTINLETNNSNLNQPVQNQQSDSPHTAQKPTATPETSNNVQVSNATAASKPDLYENACVTDKQALFQQRRSKQLERYKKEAQQRGEAFNMPSADSAALVMAEVAKAAASSCIAESEAQLNGRPSFDCAKAINDDEKLICGSRNLAAMDVKLSNAYKAALFFSVDKEAFKAQSRNWIETRRQCKDAPCVERLYTEQQAHLRAQLE
jgi:uncharacterized protein YecT (DUF1311 family)